MAYQTLIGIHLNKVHYTAIHEYFKRNNLVLEEHNDERFVRKASDPSGYKRYTFHKKNDMYNEILAGVFEVYIGKVADPTEDNLDAILQGVTEDLPEAVIHYW